MTIDCSRGQPVSRLSGREFGQIRNVSLERGANSYAEGSCLVKFGKTKVLCSASIEEQVPRWLKGTGQGWLSAEYGMLPRATNQRTPREAALGKQSGRTQEIQRLIGRSLRAALNLDLLGEQQITIDCDVLQADGGTRTAAITGGWVALYDCLSWMDNQGMIDIGKVLIEQVAAISCGLYHDQAIVDIDYREDSTVETDANFVLTGDGNIIEIQISAERKVFSWGQLDSLTGLAKTAIARLIELQKLAL